MDKPKKYARRDTETLGQLYIDHVEAMTAEKLHEKNHIAAELAWRDAIAITPQEIANQMELMQDDLRTLLDGIDDAVADYQTRDQSHHPILDQVCQVVVDRMNILKAKLNGPDGYDETSR